MNSGKEIQVIRTILCALLLALSFSSTLAGQVPEALPGSTEGASGVQASDSVSSNAGQSAEAISEEKSSSGIGVAILKMVGGLGLVLSLIIAGYFIARKVAPQYFRKDAADKHLRIIESLPMGDKRSIVLIQFDNKRFLVGNTSSQISLLAPLSGPNAATMHADNRPILTADDLGESGKGDSFRSLYEVEKFRTPRNGGNGKVIPPNIRAKMRELKAALEK
jgi:flagellar biosynthetic protein FliO